MSKPRGAGKVRRIGKGKAMGGMGMGESDPTAMDDTVADDTVRTASAMPIGGQPPSGVGPHLPIRASLIGDGQDGPLRYA